MSDFPDLDELLATVQKPAQPKRPYIKERISPPPPKDLNPSKRLPFDSDRFRWLFAVGDQGEANRKRAYEAGVFNSYSVQRARDLIDQIMGEEF